MGLISGAHAAQGAGAPPVAPVTDLPRLTGVAVVDGGAPADWGGQGAVIRAMVGDGPRLRVGDRFAATVRVGWTDAGVVAQFDVTDATPAEAADVSQLYTGDSVEVQLMSDDRSAGMAQVVASPGRTPDHAALRTHVFDYRAPAVKAAAGPVRPAAAVRRTDRGYVMDVLMPWASLNVTPAAGATVGLRVSVNDLDTADGHRQRAIWVDRHPAAEWMVLAPVRLVDAGAAAAATPPAPAAAWAGYDGFDAAFVNVIADPSLAAQAVRVTDAGQVVGTGALARDGDRATAALRLPLPPIDGTYGPLTVTAGERPVAVLPMPDLRELRADAFRSADDSGPRWGRPEPWLRPVFATTVVRPGEPFPPCAYPDPARITALIGPVLIETAYYDAALNRVTRPATAGRYGAVAQVIADDGRRIVRYETLYCSVAGSALPTTAPGTGDTAADAATPAALLAARATDPAATDYDARKADRDWWHALRTRLHAEVRYEYFVRLPRGYDDDPGKRWPVIFYLHGSGGGDHPRDATVGGPQAAARDKPGFGFITVSLRSPGGWHPPAVHDVIDRVTGTYRTDEGRYYLTGFSMGGMGTWAVALDRPDRFAAIAPVGGRAGEPAYAARLRHLPAWVINGADDNTTTSADALKAVEALRATGARDVRWTDIPAADHVQSHTIAYGWDELYAWFLTHARRR